MNPKHAASTWIFLVLLSAPQLCPQRAEAGLWVQTGFTTLATQQSSAGASTRQNPTLWTPSVGFRFPQGFVLGVQGVGARALHGSDRSWSLGFKGGLLSNGFECSGTYLPWVWDYSGTGLRKGSGFLIQLGYGWEIIGSLRLGVSGLYWVTTLTTLNDQDLVPRPRLSTLSPQVTVSFEI